MIAIFGRPFVILVIVISFKINITVTSDQFPILMAFHLEVKCF